jgi:hypothetical protein
VRLLLHEIADGRHLAVNRIAQKTIDDERLGQAYGPNGDPSLRVA